EAADHGLTPELRIIAIANEPALKTCVASLKRRRRYSGTLRTRTTARRTRDERGAATPRARGAGQASRRNQASERAPAASRKSVPAPTKPALMSRMAR